MFAYGIYWKDSVSVAPFCAIPGNLSLKTPVSLGLITNSNIESVTV